MYTFITDVALLLFMIMIMSIVIIDDSNRCY
jgi:hypothetical protein